MNIAVARLSMKFPVPSTVIIDGRRAGTLVATQTSAVSCSLTHTHTHSLCVSACMCLCMFSQLHTPSPTQYVSDSSTPPDVAAAAVPTNKARAASRNTRAASAPPKDDVCVYIYVS